MNLNIHVGATNGAHKILPKDKCLFSEMQYSKTSVMIDMTAFVYFEVNLLLSHWPLSSSFVSVFIFCTFLSCF